VSDKTKFPTVDDAIEAFNRGEYFEAAEMFEAAAQAADADFQAIAGALGRVAAALHMRFERGGRQGAINLLSQAMIALDEMRPVRGGIDIEQLYAEISAYTEEVRATPRDERDGMKRRARMFLERRRAPKIARRG